MADRDEALHYLLNKLKSEDGWSGSNLAWNEDKLSIIADQFSSFDGVAKVKVLLSFIGMTPRTINQVLDSQYDEPCFASHLSCNISSVHFSL